MMEVMNWPDLSQNFHALISRQHISIRIPLDHETGFRPQYKSEKNNREMDRSFFALHSPAFQHPCEAVLHSGKTTDFGTKKLAWLLSQTPVA